LFILFTIVGVFSLLAVLGFSCANPADLDGPRKSIINPIIPPIQDDPRLDTLVSALETSIRFEAFVDTTRVRVPFFTGTGFRLAVVYISPDSNDRQPFKNTYSISANYLDLPATSLPFRDTILPDYCKRFIGARIAVAAILLYKDVNENSLYDFGEPIWGAAEQSVFAYIDGDGLVPTAPFGVVQKGPNILSRMGQERYPQFQVAPDYRATIFIVNVRGPNYPYNIPYPWPASEPLFPK